MSDADGSDELLPPDINYFEMRWLGGLAISVPIAVLMFDYSASIVGAPRALIINIVLFAIATVLMFRISRHRSNLARWLLAVPFNLLILFYDVSHLAAEMETMGSAAAYLAPVRLGLMAWATWALFTARSRAWFAGRPDPADTQD